MSLVSVTKLLDTMRSSHIETRTLGKIVIQREEETANPFYRVGNSVVIFKIEIDHRWHSMRCYLRKTKNLEQIYGSKYHPDELLIYISKNSAEWVDVVIEEWIEGETLLTKIVEGVNSDDTTLLTLLADNFDRLASSLLTAEWAHGDLTTENIIATQEGELRLIDFDGVFLPQFTGSHSAEIGTAAFQPPSRTTSDFCRHIDDYSIALISTALRALSVEPQLYNKFHFKDGLIISPEDVARHKCEALDYIAELFLGRGMCSAFRVAQLLRSSTLHISSLAEIFCCKGVAVTLDESLFVSIRSGMGGYLTAEGAVAIPHIFDDGVDFRGGVAAVNLQDRWFKIDYRGRVVDMP